MIRPQPLQGIAPQPAAGAGSARDTGSTLRRLWGGIGAQRGGMVLAFVLTLAGTGLGLLGPWLIGRVVDANVVPRTVDGLAGACVLLLAVYLGATALTWVQSRLMIVVSQRTVTALRGRLFATLQGLPLAFFARRSHGELMSRATNDIELIALFLNQALPQLLTSVVMLLGSLAIMLWLDPWLTLLALLVVPLVALATRTVARRTRRHFSAQQASMGELSGFMEETLSGQKVVQACRREGEALRTFTGLNAQVCEAATRAQIMAGTMGPTMNAMNNTAYALMAAVGGWLALRGHTSIGVVIAFLNYSRQIERPINDFANQFNLAQSALAGAERVLDILDEAGELGGGARPAAVRGEVEFRAVSFGYQPDRPVLRGIDFHAAAGSSIALVGPTGAGKSTIVNLLMRFYEADAGAILVDGRDIRELDRDALRAHCGMVLQEPQLFSVSVRENIRFGRPQASDAEVEEVARLVQADDFIRGLPQGYDTPVAGNGGNLSQGQRQLLTIARALLADPAILILDEATSSIDSRSEAQLQAAMKLLLRGRTSFVIAHRLSTIETADRILVIAGGRIEEAGTHAELLQRRGVYHGLYRSQFGGVEKAAETA